MKKTCLRCNKTFERLDIHLSKQKICKAKYLNINKDEMLNNYNKYYEEYSKLLSNKFQCEYCQKYFTQKSSYYRHKREYCDKQQNNSQVINNGSNLGTNNGIINNGTMNIDNSVTIVLQNFSEESPISVHDLVTILNQCVKNNKLDDILPMYVKKRWIDYESNRTVNVKDASRNMAEIYVNKEWEKRFLTDVIEKIRNKSTKDIREYLISVMKHLQEEHGEKYTKIPYVERMNKVGRHLEYSNKIPEIQKKADKNIKMELINGRDKVRKTKKNLIEQD